jgi:hypothetical protein
MVSSNFKVTYDPSGTPLVLVNFANLIGEELEIPWAQDVQKSTRTRAPDGKNFGRGNVQNGLTFVVYKDHADDATARAWMFSHAVSLPKLETKTVKVEIQGGAQYLMSEAVIQSAPSRMVIHTTKARTMTTYTLVGAGWALIP